MSKHEEPSKQEESIDNAAQSDTAQTAEPETTTSTEADADAAEPSAEEGNKAGLNWEALYLEMEDRLKRLAAEFNNYKNRVNRERLDLMDTAGKKTMLALLPVLDDLDRARQAAQQDAEKLAAFESGVGLIVKKLFDALASQGLKAMETNGIEFNADQHEAITEIPHPDMAGKVVDTLERGYTLNGNIIRYAKVVVGK